MNSRTAPDARNIYCAAISFSYEGTSGDGPAQLPHYSAVIHAEEGCSVLARQVGAVTGIRPVFMADHFAGTFSHWLAEADGFDGELVIDPVVTCEWCMAPAEEPAPVRGADRKLASTKQLAFLKALFAERGHVAGVPEVRQALLACYRKGELTFAQASDTITWLQAQPGAAPSSPGPQATVSVPPGRYALPAGDGHVVFYEVSHGAEGGKWAGYVFVEQLVGSPGAYTGQRLPSRKAREDVLARLEADPQAAAALFGRKTETCGRCNAELSNVRSRAAGYGGTCAGRVGWWYPTEAEAREMLGEEGGGPAPG